MQILGPSKSYKLTCNIVHYSSYNRDWNADVSEGRGLPHT